MVSEVSKSMFASLMSLDLWQQNTSWKEHMTEKATDLMVARKQRERKRRQDPKIPFKSTSIKHMKSGETYKIQTMTSSIYYSLF
jgi:hypothetical protein